ncbi:hypothetical protein AB0O28_28920 [Microbispora sp. NPDC088329]|uniref:hypothetical protein n=1 Tax=Microbispora sp. NPDC088329 TaxID=3154869 RepID=UPI00343CCA0C
MAAWVRGPIPPGLRFHLLGRTSPHRLPRVVASLVVGAVLVAAVAGIVRMLVRAVAVSAGFGEEDPSRKVSDGQWDLLGSVFPNIAVLGCVWAVLVVFQSRPLSTLTSVEGTIRHRWLGWCACMAAAAVFAGDMLSFLLGQLDGSTQRPFYYWAEGLSTTTMYPTLIIIVLTVPAMAWWPYMMWGLVLQAPGVRTGSLWPGVALATAVSVIADGALAGGQYGPRDLLTSVVFALTGCALVVFTGGLEAGLALSVMLFLKNALKILGIEQLQVQLLPAGGLYAFGQYAGLVLYAIAAIALARILRIRTVSP